MNKTKVSLIGGPMDGKRYAMAHKAERLVVPELTEAGFARHTYKRTSRLAMRYIGVR